MSCKNLAFNAVLVLILGLGLIGCGASNKGEKSRSSSSGSVIQDSSISQDNAPAPAAEHNAPSDGAVAPTSAPGLVDVPAAIPVPAPIAVPAPVPPLPGVPPALFAPWSGGFDGARHEDSHESRECLEDSECRDNKPCTVDRCDGGICVNEPILGCAPCNQASDCTDIDPCTLDMCIAGVCKYTPVPGCAFCNQDTQDTDCLPGPTCSAPTCEANVCTYPLIPGCVFLVAIAVTPANDSISQGTQLQYTATGIFSNASMADLTNVVSWSSSAPGVATISNALGTQGLATAVANGTTNITATVEGIVGGTTLTVGCQNPPLGLLNWWPANDTPDNVAVGGINGSFPAANYIPGEVHDAFNFIGSDAVNDIVSIAKSPTLEPTRITVDAWVKASNNPGIFKYLVVKNLNSNLGSYAFYTGPDLGGGNGGLLFYVSDGVTIPPFVSGNAGTGIWDGNWHFVAGTYDGTVVHLYVDGVLVPGGTTTNISIPYDSNQGATFGAFPAASGLGYTGGLDEVEIFSRALSHSEIVSIFNAGSLGKCLP